MIILLLCFKHFGCLQLYFEVLYHGHVICSSLLLTSSCTSTFLVHLTVVIAVFSVFHQTTKLVPASGPQHLLFLCLNTLPSGLYTVYIQSIFRSQPPHIDQRCPPLTKLVNIICSLLSPQKICTL